MGTQNVSLSHARDKAKERLSWFFAELKTCHLYFSVKNYFVVKIQHQEIFLCIVSIRGGGQGIVGYFKVGILPLG